MENLFRESQEMENNFLFAKAFGGRVESPILLNGTPSSVRTGLVHSTFSMTDAGEVGTPSR